MKTTTTLQTAATTLQTAATATATALWEVTVTGTINLAEAIAATVNATGGDYPLAGAAIGHAWDQIGAEVNGGCVARNLVAGCFNTNMERANCLKLANAAGIVSRQRITQLVKVIYDGDMSANCGNKPKSADKPESEATAPSGSDSEGGGFTAAQIIRAIESTELSPADVLAIIASASAKLAK